jgi:hypothetical protein
MCDEYVYYISYELKLDVMGAWIEQNGCHAMRTRSG